MASVASLPMPAVLSALPTVKATVQAKSSFVAGSAPLRHAAWQTKAVSRKAGVGLVRASMGPSSSENYIVVAAGMPELES